MCSWVLSSLVVVVSRDRLSSGLARKRAMPPGRLESRWCLIAISHLTTLDQQPSTYPHRRDAPLLSNSPKSVDENFGVTFDHSWAPATLRACAQPFALPRTVPPGCAFGPRRGLVVRVLVLTRLRDLHA